MAVANLELKARCKDLAAARERTRLVATEHLGVDEQIDTYFTVPKGRLKLRESSLSGGQLIPYLRPDGRVARRSDYRVIPLDDPPGTRVLLEAILGRHRVVRKRREIFLHHNVRIHLDEVEGLGSFVEFEAVLARADAPEAPEREKIARLMEALALREEDLVGVSYEGLIGDRSG